MLASSGGVVLAWGAAAPWRALAAELQVLGDSVVDLDVLLALGTAAVVGWLPSSGSTQI
jgi:hypothetical protein